MSLSQCHDCKFKGDKGCAVNPDYWEVRRTIESKISTADSEKLKELIPPCKDWETAPDLEPLTLSITLSQREWLTIAHGKSASKHIIPQVREALNFTPPDDFDDIPF